MTTPADGVSGIKQALQRRHRKLRRPEKRPVLPFAGARQLLDLPDDEILLQSAKAIDEDRAVEVIHLVLEAAGEQPGSFDDLLLAVAVQALDDRARRSGQRGVEARAR